MAYWWVNQNQTGKQEIEGGYLWSPKRSNDDKRLQSYENMRIADSGDVVFSFINKKIQHIGVVQRPAVSASKPSEFGTVGGYWSNEGWTVATSWQPLKSPFAPKEIINRLRPYLPSEYSPLQYNGNGNQSYLFEISKSMADVLISEAGPDILTQLDELTADVGDGDVIGILDDEVETAIRNDTEIQDTEKLALIKARRGQGKFRKNLESLEKNCRVTGVSDHRLLRASHIKPWRSCVFNHERLDGNNGLLLAPQVDHLFDRGYISFSDDGVLLMSSKINAEQFELLGIKAQHDAGEFSEDQKQYLAYHREQVFRP